MSPLAILKLLKTAKDVHDYVKKPNNLDQQNEMILSRLDKLDEDSHPHIVGLENKVSKLSDDIIFIKNALKQLKPNKKTKDKKWYNE